MEDKIIDILQNAIANGEAPSDIKKSVVNTLDIYFNNKTALQEYAATSAILSVYDYVMRYSNDPVFSTMLQKVLKCYCDAYRKDPKCTLDVILSTYEEFLQKENMMWTVRQQTPNNPPEDFYDAVMAYFNYIGQSLEIGVKHILFELYAMIRIITGKSVDYDNIRKCDFGVTINNILEQGYFGDILKTKPTVIKLSDWRNIAYHHTYKLEKEKIICTYGRQRVTFEIDFELLQQYAHQIIRTSNILNIARCIYVFDNISNIRNHSNERKKSIGFRKDILINQLKISLSSQGFCLKRVDQDKYETKVLLLDMRNDGRLSQPEEKERKIYSSQLTYNFWCVFRKNRISIIYCDNQGKELFISSIGGDVCEKIEEGKENLSYLAKSIEFKEICIH